LQTLFKFKQIQTMGFLSENTAGSLPHCLSSKMSDIDIAEIAETIREVKITVEVPETSEEQAAVDDLVDKTADFTITDITDEDDDSGESDSDEEADGAARGPATATAAVSGGDGTPAVMSVGGEPEAPRAKHTIGQVEGDILLFANCLMQDDFDSATHVLMSLIGAHLPEDCADRLGFDCDKVMLLSNAKSDLLSAIPAKTLEDGMGKKLPPHWKETVKTASGAVSPIPNTVDSAAAAAATADDPSATPDATSTSASDSGDDSNWKTEGVISTRHFIEALEMVNQAAAPGEGVPLAAMALAKLLASITETRQIITEGIRGPYVADMVARQIVAREKYAKAIELAKGLAKDLEGAGGVVSLEIDPVTGKVDTSESKCSKSFKEKNKKMFKAIAVADRDQAIDNTEACVSDSRMFQQMLFRAATHTWMFDSTEKGQEGKKTQRKLTFEELRELLVSPENIATLVSPPLSYLAKLYALYMTAAIALKRVLTIDYEKLVCTSKMPRPSKEQLVEKEKERALFCQSRATLTNLLAALQLIRYILAPVTLCHYIWMKDQGEERHKELLDKCFLPVADTNRVDYGPRKRADGTSPFEGIEADVLFSAVTFDQSRWLFYVVPGLPDTIRCPSVDSPFQVHCDFYRKLEDHLQLEVDEKLLQEPTGKQMPSSLRGCKRQTKRQKKKAQVATWAKAQSKHM
jgi:hypothetical protein